MGRKYFQITEVIKTCKVDRNFIQQLERESVIRPVVQRRRKLYPRDQVDRIRIANLLIQEMGVNFEGAEVVLNMREQMIAMQRQFNEVLRLIGNEMKR
ncbi:MAG TPA: chaperone modulator CbpM [Candidatus Binatia bacterium]|jgi:MerR family transcriptional regulator, heat shock protein HspR|nr:chaperone modulator CbpM [Candidatus Binatia bacterium]